MSPRFEPWRHWSYECFDRAEVCQLGEETIQDVIPCWDERNAATEPVIEFLALQLQVHHPGKRLKNQIYLKKKKHQRVAFELHIVYNDYQTIVFHV